MSKRILAIQLLLGSPLLLCASNSAAQSHAPLQVDLVRAIDSARARVGDPVFAKVAVKWQDPGCALAQGAVVQGRIVAQASHSKANNVSEIALLFDSGQCGGRDMKPLPLTVAAVLSVDPVQDPDLYESQPLSDAVGLAVGGLSAPSPVAVGVGASEHRRSDSLIASNV